MVGIISHPKQLTRIIPWQCFLNNILTDNTIYDIRTISLWPLSGSASYSKTSVIYRQKTVSPCNGITWGFNVRPRLLHVVRSYVTLTWDSGKSLGLCFVIPILPLIIYLNQGQLEAEQVPIFSSVKYEGWMYKFLGYLPILRSYSGIWKESCLDYLTSGELELERSKKSTPSLPRAPIK